MLERESLKENVASIDRLLDDVLTCISLVMMPIP